jgi:hypothetical protein
VDHYFSLRARTSRAIVMAPYLKVATVAAAIIIAMLVFKDTDFALAICLASFLATLIELIYMWAQRMLWK